MTEQRDADLGMELIDGRDALGIVIFRAEGDHIVSDIKGMTMDKLTAAKLFMQMGRQLKAMHDAETATENHEVMVHETEAGSAEISST